MTKIKNLLLGFLLLFTVSFTSSCGFTTVGPREVGVKINKFGDSKGVEHKAYSTGIHFYNPTSDMIVYPVHKVNYIWDASKKEGDSDDGFNFAIKGGLGVNIDLGIEYSIEPAKAWEVYSEYPYDIDALTSIVLRKGVNDALNKYGTSMDVDSLVNGGVVELLKDVNIEFAKQFNKDGIINTKISLVGSPRYPDAVSKAINAKIKATQTAITRENELRETEAQAKKQIAQADGEAKSKMIEADGIAYYNMKTQQSLTPLLVEMRRIEAWEKTGGHVPTYLMPGSFPLLPLK